MNTVTPISEASAELARILDAYLAARQAGENPSKQTILAEHPELADELDDCLASLEFIGTAVSPAIMGEAAEVGVGSVPQAAEPIGDFRLVREIGRGGMGVVYEAIQLSLARRVALKVLPFAAVLDPKQVKRFQNEAQAAASLDHPHIVSVYSVGCERGIHYYAMQYVEGQSLAEVVIAQKNESGRAEERKNGSDTSAAPSAAVLPFYRSTALPSDTAPIAALSTLGMTNPRERFRQIARLGIQAAEALHYAHEMGIVHRDIKPSNLLVDATGHLWITDFGLATTHTDAGLTMTGDLLGTLRYMSPEQAAGDRAKTDYRTDIYSLGITLYELLTGQPAYADTDRRILLRRIIEAELKPPRSVDAAIPRDLETIVLKATEKEPHARYDSAAELAADLQRFCEEKPIRARRTSRAERLWRWSKRNRLTAALSFSVAALVTFVAITAPIIAWRQARLIDTTQQQLYVKDVSLAYNAWEEGDLAHARELLDRYADGTRYAHLRDFLWRYLDGLHRRTTAGFMEAVAFDVSLKSNLVAVAKKDDLIHLYDAETWNEVGTLPWKKQPLEILRFSPDGQFLAAPHRNGRLSVWDVAARQLLYTITIGSHTGRWYTLDFSPDGLMLATGGPDPEIRILETTTGDLLRTLPGHRDDITALAFSPDGKTLASGSLDYSLRLWDTKTWTEREVIDGAFTARVFALAFHPTGDRLAAGGMGNEVTIWNASGQRLRSLATPHSAKSLRYSRNGRMLALGGNITGTAQILDVELGTVVNECVVGHGEVSSLAFLASGELLIGAAGKLFRRDTDRFTEPVGNANAPVRSEVMSIDVAETGDVMVAGYGRYYAEPGEGAIVCWDLRSGSHWILPGHDGSSVFDVAIDPSGEFIVAGGGPSNAGFVKLWDARTRMLVGDLPPEEFCVLGLALSPAGNRLAVASPYAVAVWEGLTTRPELVWRRDTDRANRLMRVAFSPDGEVLAVGSFGGGITIWDAATREQLDVASEKRSIMDVAFSPDGGLLASIDWDGKVEVYDRREKQIVLNERAHELFGTSVAFSPDGRTLATASASGDIKFWHLPTMLHLTTLKTHGRVGELAFFPDGQTLAVGYLDRTIELWHVDRDKERFRIDDVDGR